MPKTIALFAIKVRKTGWMSGNGLLTIYDAQGHDAQGQVCQSLFFELFECKLSARGFSCLLLLNGAGLYGYWSRRELEMATL
jgi:hypothetical protein